MDCSKESGVKIDEAFPFVRGLSAMHLTPPQRSGHTFEQALVERLCDVEGDSRYCMVTLPAG